jgi:hypothetical protein
MTTTQTRRTRTENVPNPSDNPGSLAYKLGYDHGLNGVPEDDGMLMLLPQFARFYLNGHEVGRVNRA